MDAATKTKKSFWNLVYSKLYEAVGVNHLESQTGFFAKRRDTEYRVRELWSLTDVVVDGCLGRDHGLSVPLVNRKARDSRYYAKCCIYRYANVCKIERVMQNRAGYAKLKNETEKKIPGENHLRNKSGPGIWSWYMALEKEPGKFCKNFVGPGIWSWYMVQEKEPGEFCKNFVGPGKWIIEFCIKFCAVPGPVCCIEKK